MIDRIFSAALTFCVLVGATLAIGSIIFGVDRPAAARPAARAHVKVIHLEPVVVTGKRLTPTASIASADCADTEGPRVQ